MVLTGVTVARQMLGIQKTLARNGFRTLALMQERGDQAVRSLLTPGGEQVADPRSLWEGWSETGQTGREAFKAAVDVYFEMLEGMLPTSDRCR